MSTAHLNSKRKKIRYNLNRISQALCNHVTEVLAINILTKPDTLQAGKLSKSMSFEDIYMCQKNKHTQSIHKYYSDRLYNITIGVAADRISITIYQTILHFQVIRG